MADITIEEFEKEARAFLEANAEKRPVEKAFVWGEGSDNFYREKDREQEAQNAEEAKKWRQKKFDAGFGWITGPKEYGGRELPPSYDRLYSQMEAMAQRELGSQGGSQGEHQASSKGIFA